MTNLITLLQSLPKATYSSCSGKTPFLITQDAVLRIMKVTQREDYEALMERFIQWNSASYEEQVAISKVACDFCEISRLRCILVDTILVSIHRMSDTKSVYLTLHHDSEHVMMDIQL